MWARPNDFMSLIQPSGQAFSTPALEAFTLSLTLRGKESRGPGLPICPQTTIWMFRVWNSLFQQSNHTSKGYLSLSPGLIFLPKKHLGLSKGHHLRGVGTDLEHTSRVPTLSKSGPPVQDKVKNRKEGLSGGMRGAQAKALGS